MFLPVLVRSDDPATSADVIRDPFLGDLEIAYIFAPPLQPRLLTWSGLERTGMTLEEVRHTAVDNLYDGLGKVAIHGQPPAMMLSFEGLETSVLLAYSFWDRLAASVPGEVVVGAPARDVVIFTSSESAPGLRKVCRAVDRMFFAGGSHLLSQELLVWRQQGWELFHPPGRAELGAPTGEVPAVTTLPSTQAGLGSALPGSPVAAPGSPMVTSGAPAAAFSDDPMPPFGSPMAAGAGATLGRPQPAPGRPQPGGQPARPQLSRAEAVARPRRGRRRANGRAR